MNAWCTFKLDGRHYGIDVTRVQEVLGGAEFSRLPLAPPSVRGLVNLRGQIVTAVDLRVCLALPGETPAAAPHIVIAGGGTPVSLLVDAIGDVERAGPEALKPVPDTLDRRTRELMRGAVPLPGRLLLVLNLDRVLETALAA
jgi:purine-binding chemotaxis protein CheW